MAATYSTVPLTVPSSQRSMMITSVAAGDTINVVDILHRPARGVRFYMTATGDTIEYRLNNLQILSRYREDNQQINEYTEHWNVSSKFPVYSATGAIAHETEDGLRVSSIQVTALSLSTGSTISILVW